MIFFHLAALLIFCCGLLYSYEKPEALSEADWNEVQSYLLPESHALKPKLDKIFKKAGVIQNEKSLKAAGFKNGAPRPWSQTIVTKHDKMKGFVFKLFTEDQTHFHAYAHLKSRIIGAKSVQAAIDQHHFQNYFKVPNKWLYPVKDSRHCFILIAEECSLLTEEGNKAKWKNTNDAKLLTALFTLLQQEGLSDSIYLVNIPFDMNGKVCFIDLENHHQWPVKYDRLTPCFSSKMQKHWISLFSAH